MLKDIRSYSTRWTVCRRILCSGYSLCFLVSVWSSCSFLCKCHLVLKFPNIYVWSVHFNWIDTMCSQQAHWRTAFTHTYLSEQIMWRDIVSSSIKGTGCRGNFYTGFSVCFIVLIWGSCSFHWNTDFEILPAHLHVCNLVCNRNGN